MKNYSAIIVTFNNGDELFDCLESLLKFENCKEIILVDNGNNIETRNKIKDFCIKFENLKHIINLNNFGFGKACNIGAKCAKYGDLLFLNPDAILLEKSLENLEIKNDESTKKLIGGLILDENNNEQKGARRGELNILSAISSFLGLYRFFKNKELADFNKNNEILPISPIIVENISGAFFTIAKEDFEQLKGFDEGFFLHLEDIDICKRFRNLGGVIYFNPNAIAIHKGGASKASKFIVEWHKYKGFIRYFWKHGNYIEKFLTIFISLPLFILIMGRVFFQQFRNKF